MDENEENEEKELHTYNLIRHFNQPLLPWTIKPGWRCVHRSHKLKLPCFRYWTYDHFCGKHNEKCWNAH